VIAVATPAPTRRLTVRVGRGDGPRQQPAGGVCVPLRLACAGLPGMAKVLKVAEKAATYNLSYQDARVLMDSAPVSPADTIPDPKRERVARALPLPLSLSLPRTRDRCRAHRPRPHTYTCRWRRVLSESGCILGWCALGEIVPNVQVPFTP
jgi:hypothetical protein